MTSQILDNSLLEVIPAHRLTRDQVAHWRGRHTTPTYRLRREPKTLYELLESYRSKLAIWMDNETLVQVTQNENHLIYQRIEKYITLMCCLENPERSTTITISGKTDDAIADTAMFLWGLYCPEECNPRLQIENQSNTFDFGAFTATHLSTIFASNPKRGLSLCCVTLNAAQSVFLATRGHPITLTFKYDVGIEDEGDAFVNALQTRESPFGSLHCCDDIPFRQENLVRLMRPQTFEQLTLSAWDTAMALLPFSASMKKLEYTLDSTEVLVADIQTLDILAEDLVITIIGDALDNRMEVILSFLGRLAGITHLKRLALKFSFQDGGVIEADSQRIFKELLRVVAGNQELESLDLGTRQVFQEDQWMDLLEVCCDHSGLRSINIDVWVDNGNFFDYPWFRQLLSRNRRIEVRGNWMHYVTDVKEIDELYALNRFCNACESLREMSHADRTALIGTALTEKASRDFQRSAFLIASYSDALCEYIQFANMDSLPDSSFSFQISDSLLEVIPADQITQEQVAGWRGRRKTFTYKLRREPKTLCELERYGRRIAVWMNNETLVLVTQIQNYPDWEQLRKYFRLTFYLDNPQRTTTVTITGKTDDAIAETAMFWWGLHCPEECNPWIVLDNNSRRFDFSAVKTEHLATLFVGNEKRRLKINDLKLNAAQSVFLATRTL